MKFFQVNTYECITKPKVVSTIPICEWFSQIKSSIFSEQIEKARFGELDYVSTKAKMPCVTYNFHFEHYKKDSNIKGSSGLIYIDIDNPEFEINTLDKNKIFAYYRSFGGQGYSIIVKTSGVTIDNFSTTYTNITNELGVSDYVDIQAAKASQFNVLSFDTDIFVNNDSFTFPSVSAPHSNLIIEKERTYTIERGASNTPIRFDNLDEIPIEGKYEVNWGGYEIVKCFMPFRKITNRRNNMLLSYCNNLVYLNPNITEEKILKILEAVNRKCCENPVDKNQLLRVITSVLKYYKDGKLKPIYFRKKRKIVFNLQSGLSKEQKLEVCRNELSKRKKELSLQKLYDIIEQWEFKKHGIISQRKIYRNHPIAKKTVEKYWCNFKELVSEVNDSFKANFPIEKNYQEKI